MPFDMRIKINILGFRRTDEHQAVPQLGGHTFLVSILDDGIAACTAYSCCFGLILRRIYERNGEMFE